MSKADEIKEKWINGEKQIDIATILNVSEAYVSKVLAPLKNPNPITPVIPDYIKKILERVHRNLDKTWGYDNKTGKEKKRPKYRNLWEDWEFFKEFFETLT